MVVGGDVRAVHLFVECLPTPDPRHRRRSAPRRRQHQQRRDWTPQRRAIRTLNAVFGECGDFLQYERHLTDEEG
jgi:hypothetical protein